MALAALLTPLMFLVGTILLLLATLSVPIIKSIFIFALGAVVDAGFGGATATGSVKFGVWGYCTSGVQAQAFGITRNTPAECSKAKLGYKIDSQVVQFLSLANADDISDVIQRALTFVLVLHPIATALAFIALIFSLIAFIRRNNGRLSSFIATGFGFLAAVLTTIVFIIDIVLVAVARSRIHNATEGHVWVTWGNAVWMTLGALIALWIGTLGACFHIFSSRKQRNTERY